LTKGNILSSGWRKRRGRRRRIAFTRPGADYVAPGKKRLKFEKGGRKEEEKIWSPFPPQKKKTRTFLDQVSKFI
jgi:hypothetical protein